MPGFAPFAGDFFREGGDPAICAVRPIRFESRSGGAILLIRGASEDAEFDPAYIVTGHAPDAIHLFSEDTAPDNPVVPGELRQAEARLWRAPDGRVCLGLFPAGGAQYCNWYLPCGPTRPPC
ncbi:hypothetical protein [Pseudogemmobacter humi]|uniref:hypothetical protein n=1 Tax=Pseudogemmobacter humi TaxID=2483812 RepID=UPI0013599137|nr:hypothetical protein [Pseudogemmobacter humi]